MLQRRTKFQLAILAVFLAHLVFDSDICKCVREMTSPVILIFDLSRSLRLCVVWVVAKHQPTKFVVCRHPSRELWPISS